MDFHFPRTSLDNKEVLTYLEQAWNRTGSAGSTGIRSHDTRQPPVLTRDFNFRIHPADDMSSRALCFKRHYDSSIASQVKLLWKTCQSLEAMIDA